MDAGLMDTSSLAECDSQNFNTYKTFLKLEVFQKRIHIGNN